MVPDPLDSLQIGAVKRYGTFSERDQMEIKPLTMPASVRVEKSHPRFWEALHPYPNRISLIDAKSGQRISYLGLVDAIDAGIGRLRGPSKLLICLAINNDLGGILCYLSALSSGHALVLSGPNSLSSHFIDTYRPDIVLWSGPDWPLTLPPGTYASERTLFGYHMASSQIPPIEGIHEDLALLLSTSGSTGNPRLVRLSYANLAANAWQIASSLSLNGDDRAMLSLPLYYVYGLSVLHTLLAVSGTVVVNTPPVVSPSFWGRAVAENATMIPVVPSQLNLLRGANLDAVPIPPSLSLTISGSAMDASCREWLISQIVPRNVKVHSMYGMTEAAGRIAVLPACDFLAHPTSVGRAVPGGRLDILPTHEIVYSGPNVMMGYADARESLSMADSGGDLLRTGDLGTIDADGNLYITSRLNRFCKILGIKISLDDLEKDLGTLGEVAVVSDDISIYVFHTTSDVRPLIARTKCLAARLHIPRCAFELIRTDIIPRATSGKIRYAGLLGKT
jgi:long-chain acyl-CoA synthetase